MRKVETKRTARRNKKKKRISKVNSLKRGGGKTAFREWGESRKRACDKRKHIALNGRKRVKEHEIARRKKKIS